MDSSSSSAESCPVELAHRDQTSDSEQLASKDGQEVSQTEHEAEIQRPKKDVETQKLLQQEQASSSEKQSGEMNKRIPAFEEAVGSTLMMELQWNRDPQASSSEKQSGEMNKRIPAFEEAVGSTLMMELQWNRDPQAAQAAADELGPLPAKEQTMLTTLPDKEEDVKAQAERKPIKGIPAVEFEATCDLIFNKYDKDKDEILCYEELCSLMEAGGCPIEEYDAYASLCQRFGCDARFGLSREGVYKLFEEVPLDAVWEEVSEGELVEAFNPPSRVEEGSSGLRQAGSAEEKTPPAIPRPLPPAGAQPPLFGPIAPPMAALSPRAASPRLPNLLPMPLELQQMYVAASKDEQEVSRTEHEAAPAS